MEERWKFYKETYSNGTGHIAYEVSDWGNVKVNGVLVDWSKFVNSRYYCIGGFFVHKAVAELFIPNPNNYTQVDHIDTNKHNNHYTNLRWCTQKMNSNNPLTRKHNSEAQKIAQNKPDVKQRNSDIQKIIQNTPELKQRSSETSKGNKNTYDHTWMNNNIDRVLCDKSKINYYLSLGYHFGKKLK